MLHLPPRPALPWPRPAPSAYTPTNPPASPRQASKSCGDLIFSSHTTFLLVFMWTYCVMGKYLVLKVGAP